jgi:hypothetical protein
MKKITDLKEGDLLSEETIESSYGISKDFLKKIRQVRIGPTPLRIGSTFLYHREEVERFSLVEKGYAEFRCKDQLHYNFRQRAGRVTVQEFEECVYFIQQLESRAIKIGWTVNFRNRLRALRAMNGGSISVLLVTNGNRETELELHQRWQGYRLHGEWFKPNREILGYIQQRVKTI